MEELIGYSMLVFDSYSTLESNNKVITAVILLKLHLNMNGNHAYNLILVVGRYSTLESNNKVITAVILLKLHLSMNGNHAYNLILEERNLNGIELMLISCACS